MKKYIAPTPNACFLENNSFFLHFPPDTEPIEDPHHIRSELDTGANKTEVRGCLEHFNIFESFLGQC